MANFINLLNFMAISNTFRVKNKDKNYRAFALVKIH
jgi:hypothetical protein